MLQEERMDRMDHFFASVASLMSNLLRSCVENSIDDLLDLLEEYSDGNVYAGEYSLFCDLALPQLKHPLKIFVVINERSMRVKVDDKLRYLMDKIEKKLQQNACPSICNDAEGYAK